ncbi:MAG: DUF1924 domain-containing protein [Alcanivoracaceae bacterium]|nr:DUF1924 domain-containing protein [Alcanivoracaceae bacterium]
MNKKTVVTCIYLFISQMTSANSVDEMFNSYQKAGVSTIKSNAGKNLWDKSFTANTSNDTRSCTNCHGSDITKAGEHARTGKRIEPMAASVNPKRFTDVKKIKEWFFRNCKWTLGRECSAQEQADILSYLNSQ